MSRNLVILTGAGISAESGVPTFRGSDGLWEGHSIHDVATPEGFERNPALVHRFYNLRRAALAKVHPNPAHLALAELERRWRGNFLLITQNIDDLHERGGSQNLIHMHGQLLRTRCTHCMAVFEWMEETRPDSLCDACLTIGSIRPHVVWFGEMPIGMDECLAALAQADLFAAIGTSGAVYPAAGFVEQAARAGAHTVEINLEPSFARRCFADHRIGPASLTVPQWVEELLSVCV